MYIEHTNTHTEVTDEANEQTKTTTSEMIRHDNRFDRR